ncbi:MAG: GNAT family N-acetyltransferase [Acidobacteria bacterium]|nr:MAG: GNAT family N-acetyltransferase [Acidobacteriota bacterium]
MSTPLYIPAPYQDSAESGRLILRDGSTATIRVATVDDASAMADFFHRLSPQSRQQRFFSFAEPTLEFVRSLSDSSNPRAQLTLVVIRKSDDRDQVVAAGSYVGRDATTAEVAMAVEDRLQGKGIGTHLLERLALLAAQAGFTRFWAITQSNNRGMIEVFRRSGFPMTERFDGGYVELDFSVLPTESSVELSEIRDRVFTAASIRWFFKPSSVAVIGASREPSSIGYRILQALVSNRFQGSVYPVNVNAAMVGSMRAYPSMLEIPEPVDLAIVSVPRDHVLAVVDDCAARGVKAIIVITAAFAEADESGRVLQKQLLERVRGYGMRMIGPNCMGLLNTDPRIQLNASFSPVFPPAGHIAMSSQSGALGLAILALAVERGLGISTFVSVGNKADVSGNDLLQYWEVDDTTRVILLYLESFGNPRRFARIARRVGRTKPIIAVKAGRTLAGRRAAGSHTAALAANDVAVDALFRQTGVIRAETLDEMFDLAAALENQPLPAGRRIGIITNAGGPGILCTDACEANGLAVPEFFEKTQSALRQFLPASAGLSNPVDMIASAGAASYQKTIEAILPGADIDALIVIYIPVDRNDSQAVAQAICDGVRNARAAGGGGKPVLACLMASEGSRTLITENEVIPSYRFPEAAAKVLSKAANYAEWRLKPPALVPGFADVDKGAAKTVIARAIQARGSGWLSAEECRAVLSAFKIPQAAGGLARTSLQAVEMARTVGYPVAAKLASPRVLHKSDIGAVRLNLENEDTVRQAFEEIKQEGMEGILVQKMLHGVEVMIGVTEDSSFGPLIAFGLGGIHVEVLADVCFRVTPLTDQDAEEMIRQIRGYRLLEGYRGHPPADIDAIKSVLLRVSRMVEDIPEIRELDLNPIFALPPGQGCFVVDARIRVE